MNTNVNLFEYYANQQILMSLMYEQPLNTQIFNNKKGKSIRKPKYVK